MFFKFCVWPDRLHALAIFLLCQFLCLGRGLLGVGVLSSGDDLSASPFYLLLLCPVLIVLSQLIGEWETDLETASPSPQAAGRRLSTSLPYALFF